MNSLRILITGGKGQLGSEFSKLAESYGPTMELFVFDRTELDIVQPQMVQKVFEEIDPHWCINCAAYTAVDLAESNPEAAFAVNETGVGMLADECKRRKIPLIHFSTDYVYHSITDRPILEDDPCLPQGIYAKSKRAGEKMIQDKGCPHLILRVSWLYSSYGSNFVKTMLRLGQTRSELTVVSDQHGSPTYAQDLAQAIIKIIEQEGNNPTTISGIYNYSNGGTTNWADFARRIFSLSDINCQVKNISTEAYNAAAQRPSWSVLSKKRIVEAYGLAISPWEKSLERCLDLLQAKK